MRKVSKVLVIAAALSVAVATMGAWAAGNAQKDAEKQLRFGYISKMLTHPWFIDESKGLATRSKELGVDYIAIDANQDDEAFMAAFDNLLARNVDAIFFCITDPKLGPAIVDRARAAKVPIMTIDDNIKDSKGNPIPHVGMPTTEVGYQGGEALANEARKRGFFKAGNVVKVMSVNVSFKEFLNERTLGYHAALKKFAPEIPARNFIDQDNKTGMFEDVLPVAAAILNANPDATHWIVTGINDDSALAPLRIFEENGFPLDRVISCGLGGYKSSLEEFQKAHSSYIVNKTQPYQQGYMAAQLMYDHIKQGKALPETTYVPGVIVTKENYTTFEWNM